MSNHATLIAAKRQEIASLTAKIETKLTWQGEPAVEAESMKNAFKDAELSCAEAKEALASARDLEPRNFQPFTKQRSSMASQSASTVEVELPNSRLSFASSICGVVSIRTVTHRKAMIRFYSMGNLMEMTARSCVASRGSTRSVLRK